MGIIGGGGGDGGGGGRRGGGISFLCYLRVQNIYAGCYLCYHIVVCVHGPLSVANIRDVVLWVFCFIQYYATFIVCVCMDCMCVSAYVLCVFIHIVSAYVLCVFIHICLI